MNKIIINYRYKEQNICKSYVKCDSLDELKQWLDNFQINKNQNIDLIVIDFPTEPLQFNIQIFKNGLNRFEISLIINDYVIGNINSINDLLHLLRIRIIKDVI